jgi:hypothetical protein
MLWSRNVVYFVLFIYKYNFLTAKKIKSWVQLYYETRTENA